MTLLTGHVLQMTWYVPGEKELEAAVHVFEALVEPSLAALRDMPQGELTTPQKVRFGSSKGMS